MLLIKAFSMSLLIAAFWPLGVVYACAVEGISAGKKFVYDAADECAKENAKKGIRP